MKKVLVINTLGLNYEGITMVIYNYTSNMDVANLQLDFIAYENINLNLKIQFEKIGHVITLPRRKKNLFAYIWCMDKILKNNKYDVVHIHGNSGTMVIESLLAKMHRVKNVIVHCHNTKCNHPKLNKILVPIMNLTANHFLACSKAAGDWLYGTKGFLVLNNAIDVEKFRFDIEIRNEYKEKFGIKDEFVVGHIGHFTEQKNHEFIVDLFAKLCMQIPNSKLILVSDGPLIEKIKGKVIDLGLKSKVIFAGRRTDSDRMYQVMDAFIFPSKWEGLGLVLIEAQASGLPCIASTNVPNTGNVTGNVKYLSLETENEWINYLLRCSKQCDDRTHVSETNIKKIGDSGYNIKYESNKLRDIYLK